MVDNPRPDELLKSEAEETKNILPKEIKQAVRLIFKYRDLVNWIDQKCITQGVHNFRRFNIALATTMCLWPYLGIVSNKPAWAGTIGLCILNTALTYFPLRDKNTA